MSPYIAAFIFPLILTSLPVPAAEKTSSRHDAATTMLHCGDGIGQVMSGAWFPQDMTLGIQAKEFNLCFIRPDNLVSHGLRVLQVPFGKLQAGCDVPFTKKWFPSGHSTIQACLVECCRQGRLVHKGDRGDALPTGKGDLFFLSDSTTRPSDLPLNVNVQ